jgi:HEAT repeat protein
MLLNNSIPYAQKLFRARVSYVLLAFALLAMLVPSVSHAQQPANSNAAGQQQPKRAKRITPLRASDSSQGSRVTITSDGELNDYSAYRSGDRFIVVIPQAQGGEGSGARGRGFEGAQVSRRGNDLVYTFKLQPGASAKVSQHFNRLDVQFTAAKGSETAASAQPAATPAPTPRTPAEIAGIRPTASPTPARANAAVTTNQSQGVTSPAVAANPNNVSPSFPSIGTTPATTPSVAPSIAPTVAPATTPVQLAQAQATPAAPVNIVAPSTVATTSTLGAFVQHNWHWFIGALLVVGVGLLLVTRLGERQTVPAPPTNSPELRAAKATEEKAITAKPQTVALVTPLSETTAEAAPVTPVEVAPATTPEVVAPKIVAPMVAATSSPVAAQTKKQDRKKKRGKKGRAVAEPVANVEAAKTAPVEAEKIPVAESVISNQGAEVADPASTVSDSASKVLDVLTPAALIAGGALVESKRAGASVADVDDAPAADTERVGEEIRKLFAGEAYDESVVGARDRATREMVSSELLAGLSSRNAQRNERARAAFLKHGYFEDATRDLQSAEAPAQRASAAHALSLLRDRTTTSHLVAALEDPSSDVRRASVEALAELRDPAALGPLEALRWRETSRQVPRALILRAVEACTPSVEETEAALAREGAKSTPETIAPVDAQTAEAITEPEAATHEASISEAATPEAKPSSTDQTNATDAPDTLGSTDATDESSSDVTIETAAATTAPVDDEEEFEMIAGVEIPRARGGATEAVNEAAFESEATSILEVPAAESTVETAHEQFVSQPDQFVESEDIVTDHVAAESRAFDEQETKATADDETTDAVEPPAFVEPRVEEIEATDDTAIAARMQAVEESASTEPLTSEAGEISATALTDETVYTFDEGAASDWSTRREERATPEASGGTGGLDERVTARLESPERASEKVEDEAAEHSPVYAAPEFAVASGASVADDWLDVDVDEQPVANAAPPQVASEPGAEFEAHAAPPAQVFEPMAGSITESTVATSSQLRDDTSEHTATKPAPEVAPPTKPARSFVPDAGDASGTGVTLAQKGIELSGIEPEDVSIIPKSIQLRLGSEDAAERAASVRALARLDTDEAFHQICAAFDDPAQEVRNAAARALHDSSDDRAESFTRALRESAPERRRSIGASLATSGLAEEAVSQLTGESREKTYDAFSLLFLMAKAGETAPLIRAVESHPESEVRLAVVKLLALSGQQEVLPSFKRLAVRGSLPNEVRSAVMEAIYQISSSNAAQPTKPARSVS